jgi:hypothetical protein
MDSTRFDVRNRNSAFFVSAEYTGSRHVASVGYLTLASPPRLAKGDQH